MEKKFTTVINCMDGRIQQAVIEYMQKKYDSLYVDMITAAGPCKMLAEDKKTTIIKDLKYRTTVSVEKHFSKVVAVVGHFDCALIQKPDSEQQELLKESVLKVSAWFDDVEVIGLWVSSEIEVSRI